jgi:transposase
LRLTWKTDADPQGAPLPPGLRERVRRECERLALVERQIDELARIIHHEIHETHESSLGICRSREQTARFFNAACLVKRRTAGIRGQLAGNSFRVFRGSSK